MKSDDLQKRSLTLTRTFNAPVKLVWEAWTQSSHIAQWWGPPGMEVEVIENDFRVGGKWQYTMKMPDGNLFITEGVYSEIVECQKIISSANFKPMTEGVEIQVYLEDKGEKTEFTFTVVHPTEEYCKQQEKMGFYNGWGSVYDRLNDFVSALYSKQNV